MDRKKTAGFFTRVKLNVASHSQSPCPTCAGMLLINETKRTKLNDGLCMKRTWYVQNETCKCHPQTVNTFEPKSNTRTS